MLKINVHSNFEIKPIDIKKAETLLAEGWNLLSDITSKWISAGTALGVVRDGGLIEGDTDIDVAAIGFDGIEQKIDEALIPEGYKPIVSCYWDGKPMQKAYIKDNTIFDVYLHYPDGENYVNYGQSGKTVMPKTMYDNLESVTTMFGDFLIPSDIDKYLTKRYGDWRTKRQAKSTFEAV